MPGIKTEGTGLMKKSEIEINEKGRGNPTEIYGHKVSGNQGSRIIMQVENLSKTYTQGKIPVHALRCACITVRKGELLGNNGAFRFRKSTLLALIGTLEKATDGKIILDGTDLTSVPEKLASPREKGKNRIYFPAL